MNEPLWIADNIRRYNVPKPPAVNIEWLGDIIDPPPLPPFEFEEVHLRKVLFQKVRAGWSESLQRWIASRITV